MQKSLCVISYSFACRRSPLLFRRQRSHRVGAQCRLSADLHNIESTSEKVSGLIAANRTADIPPICNIRVKGDREKVFHGPVRCTDTGLDANSRHDMGNLNDGNAWLRRAALNSVSGWRKQIDGKPM